MVSSSVLNFLMEISVLSFVFPVVILLAWKMRTHRSLIPAFIGIPIYIGFAKLFASVPNVIFIGMENPISDAILSNKIIYAIYVGIIAAVFEEIGRFIAFKYFLTKYNDRQDAITYGIGHGGIECMIMLGWTYLEYYVTGTLLNNEKGLSDVPKTMQTYLENLTSVDCVLDGISEIFLLALQIALSILIFQAVRNDVLRRRLIGLSMIFHAVFYIPNGLYEANLIPHIVSLLLELLVLGIAVVLAADIYKKMGENAKKKVKEQKKKDASTDKNIWNVAGKKLTNIDDKKKMK